MPSITRNMNPPCGPPFLWIIVTPNHGRSLSGARGAEPGDNKILVNNNAKFEQTKKISACFACSIVYPTLKIVLPPVIAITILSTMTLLPTPKILAASQSS